MSLDPEYQTHMASLASKSGPPPPPPPENDLLARRTFAAKTWPALLSQLPTHPQVTQTLIAHVTSAQIPIHKFSSPSAEPSPAPAILYLHGGGFFGLSVDLYAPLLAHYAALSKRSIYAVEYRLAPEHKFPTQIEDCFAALEWLHAQSDVDSSRIAIMGDSAGGGLAASVAILARDRGVKVARQIVLHGNLDDRTTELPEGAEEKPQALWTYTNNKMAWWAYLGEDVDGEKRDALVPARVQDVRSVASMYMDVPALDILCDEGIEYARKLIRQGVDVELHVYPGVPHSFELFAPGIKMAERAFENRVRAMTSF